MFKLPGINSYMGGKAASGTYQRIINHIRPHDTLAIPFAGNCAVTRAIQWPGRVLINDLDTAVLDAWRGAALGLKLETFNLSALDFIRNVIQSPRIGRLVIYCDPPYPLETRTSANRYNFEMTAAQQLQFLEAVRWLRVDCLVSTYPNDLYTQQLSHWNRTEFQSMTCGGPRTEWLFYNYPTPTVLHDARFAGNDYREREYIKRKATRWVTKWKQLQPHERQHILHELMQETRPELLTMTITATHDEAARSGVKVRERVASK